MKSYYLTFSLVVFLGMFSCTKDDTDSTPEPITRGNISGTVNLYDEGVTQVANSNMTIRIEGTTPSISATTDANGNFTLKDVPFGTYTILYEKSGFGTFKKVDVEHLSNETAILNTPSLGEISTTQITNVEANVSGDDIIISITTNPAGSNGNTRYVRYFLATDPTVSNENYTYSSEGLVSKINPKEITLSDSFLKGAGFFTGQILFIKVYGDSFWSNEYYDTNLGRKVFPNLNMTSATAVSFLVQ